MSLVLLILDLSLFVLYPLLSVIFDHLGKSLCMYRFQSIFIISFLDHYKLAL